MASAYRSAADHTFHTIDPSRPEVERLTRRARPVVVVIEACSLAGWGHDLCGELGIPYRVATVTMA